VRNAVRLIVAQRLVRRLCDCSRLGDVERDARAMGIEVSQCHVPGACNDCRHTGYSGRTLIAEWLAGDMLSQSVSMPTSPGSEGMPPSVPTGDDLWASARALVESGGTSAAEVVRVLGLRS
jgi:type II secretory ATPase GspE/PulE/Tfp pilus assembly ATPase PilB-like protein